MWRLLLLVALVACSCGGAAAGGGPSPSPSNTVIGAPSCAPAERQDLTFSGALQGHIMCSAVPPVCGTFRSGLGNGGLVVPVRVRRGSESILVAITILGSGAAPYRGGTGTFAINGAIALEGGGTDTPAGGSLDGPVLGHWDTTAGGSVAVSAASDSGSSGTVNADLRSRSGAVTHLSGSWSCTEKPG